MQSDHDLVSSQALQPGGVSGPISGRPGGNTPIVVQVYALKCGVTIKTESSGLINRKDFFELEAFGKFLTFDMAGAISAQGLAAPIQGHVAAVSLPLKAMDQKDVAELERINSHGACSLKTVIVNLPPESGKTVLAEQLMARFGCTSIVEEWCNRDALTPGALHLTNQDLFAVARQAEPLNITDRERALLSALAAIICEAADYPDRQPQSSDSYLPDEFILAGVEALSLYLPNFPGSAGVPA